MKEDLLRGMIRKQIKSSLKTEDFASRARGQVGSTLDKIEKMAGVKMLKKALGSGSPQQQAAATGTDQNTDLNTAEPSKGESLEEAVPASLKSRQGRVDKTAAMKMMKSTLATKPATQQADFVIDLIKSLEIKRGAKQRLFQKMRRELGGKSEE